MVKIFLVLLLSSLISIYPKKTREEVDQYAVTFKILNAGFDVEGDLSKINVSINFDPAHLDQSYIVATADPTSIKTGIAIRDKHLLRKDYFYVEKFAEIKLVSKSFRRLRKNTYSGDFDLTIKDTTRQVTIVFKSTNESSYTFLKGNFEINRLDFNLGEESAVLGDNVTVSVSAAVQ